VDGLTGASSPATKTKPATNRTRRNLPGGSHPSQQRRLLDWQLHSPTFTVIDPIVLLGGTNLEGTNNNGGEGLLRSHPTASKLQQQQKNKYSSDSGGGASTIAQWQSEDLCMSVPLFGALISACTFLLTISAVVFASFLLLRHQRSV
jgi:hypothetical protein